jgi:hypothetical protein
MKNTRRIKRMSRNRTKITKMNLTSLMDVFTILVFFLLVNSANSEILDTPKQIKLPESMVESKPRETVVIFISPEQVMVQGQPVAMVADILAMEGQDIAPIADQLALLDQSIVGIRRAQSQRYAPDRFQVRRDLVARGAVTPRGAHR